MKMVMTFAYFKNSKPANPRSYHQILCFRIFHIGKILILKIAIIFSDTKLSLENWFLFNINNINSKWKRSKNKVKQQQYEIFSMIIKIFL